MKTLKTVKETANHLLQKDIDPVVHFRLLRDVLKIPSTADILLESHRKMLQSRWVRELKTEQREDGSWGRFHSATKTNGRIATTEAAVERGLALGLTASDPVFHETISYISHLLQGSVNFPDPSERNNRWATGTQLFAAATLARICPSLPILDKIWNLWATIAVRTFASGKYDEETEAKAHKMLTGASTNGKKCMCF